MMFREGEGEMAQLAMFPTCGGLARSCKLALFVLMAASFIHRVKSIRSCREMSNLKTEQMPGDVLILDDRSSCNRTAGLVTYAWEVVDSSGLYPQIEIYCYSNRYPGSWVILESRTYVLRGVYGEKLYTIPPVLLSDTNVTCEIQGCYQYFGGISIYPTNKVSISCSLPEMATSILSTPTTSLKIISSSITIAHTPIFTQQGSPLPRPNNGRSYTLVIVLLVPVNVSVFSVFFFIFCCYCCCLYKRKTRFIETSFFLEKEFDPTLEPSFQPVFAGETNTIFSSEFSLIPVQMVTEERDGGGSDGVGESQSLNTNQDNSDICSAKSLDSSKNLALDAIANLTSPGGVVAPVGMDTNILNSSKELLSELLGENDEHNIMTVGEERDGEQRQLANEGKEKQKLEELPVHFLFDFPPQQSSSSGSGATSSRYLTGCSSGYVTDSSDLVLSPLGLLKYSPRSKSRIPTLELCDEETEMSAWMGIGSEETESSGDNVLDFKYDQELLDSFRPTSLPQIRPHSPVDLSDCSREDELVTKELED